MHTDTYKDTLRREGLKNTRHRQAILNLLETSGPLPAEEIYLRLKHDDHPINLSSVYRILDKLEEKGMLEKTSLAGDARSLYEIHHPEHTHKLVCSGCKKLISVDGCPLDEYEKRLQEKMDFTITGHKLEIYGMCGECRRKE